MPKKIEPEAEGGGALAVIEGASLPSLFVDTAKMDAVIAQVRAIVAGFKHDMSTATSRKRTASLAYSVSQLKSRMEKARLDLTEEHRKAVGIVNEEGKRIGAILDEIKADARRELDEWEAAEALRVERLDKRLAAIRAHLDALGPTPEITAVLTAVADVEAIATGEEDGWQEYRAKAQISRADTLRILAPMLENAKERERAAEKAAADAAELETLRAEKAARDAKDAQERADREAKEAEENAAKEREAQAAREAEDRRILMENRLARLAGIAERSMGQPLTALAVAKANLPAEDFPWGDDFAERGAAARASALSAIEAAENAETERVEAERVAEVERVRLKAIEDERAAAAKRRADDETEAERLAADKRHRAKIESAILAGIVDEAIGLEIAIPQVQDFAQRVTRALMASKIPHTKVTF